MLKVQAAEIVYEALRAASRVLEGHEQLPFDVRSSRVLPAMTAMELALRGVKPEGIPEYSAELDQVGSLLVTGLSRLLSEFVTDHEPQEPTPAAAGPTTSSQPSS